jgi:hypothetical protein
MAALAFQIILTAEFKVSRFQSFKVSRTPEFKACTDTKEIAMWRSSDLETLHLATLKP